MEKHPQQHQIIKSNTHVERGLIIYDRELHNVRIHWLLSSRREERKQTGFKFSIHRKRNHCNYLSKVTYPPGKNFPPISQSRMHTKHQKSHCTVRLLCLLLTCSARQAADFIEKRWNPWSLCSFASWTVITESGTAALTACYQWHTHAAGTSSEAGTQHPCPDISLLQHLTKIA